MGPKANKIVGSAKEVFDEENRGFKVDPAIKQKLMSELQERRNQRPLRKLITIRIPAYQAVAALIITVVLFQFNNEPQIITQLDQQIVYQTDTVYKEVPVEVVYSEVPIHDVKEIVHTPKPEQIVVRSTPQKLMAVTGSVSEEAFSVLNMYVHKEVDVKHNGRPMSRDSLASRFIVGI